MSSPAKDRQPQSLLARRAYNSLTPTVPRKSQRLLAFRPANSVKFNFLGETSNQTQLILKDIVSKETRFMQNWRSPGAGPSFPMAATSTYNAMHSNLGIGNPGRRSLSQAVPYSVQAAVNDNLKLIAAPADKLNPPPNSEMMFGRSRVRTNSFDPILGQERKFPTPPASFRALGTNGADAHYSNWLYRGK